MKLMRKLCSENAVQYDGNNLEEIRNVLCDMASQIQPYVDGMLRVDTQHGRLAVRVQEWILKDDQNCYSVYSNNEFNALFIEAN